MPSPSLALIVACASNRGIGAGNQLPWRLRKEMAYFLKVTTSAPSGQRNAVIMGRNTWESIPVKFRPLKNRINIVVSSRPLPELGQDDVHLAASLAEAIQLLSSASDIHHAFVIGGAQLYTAALQHPSTSRVLISWIGKPDYPQCDTFFPELAVTEWQRAPYSELKAWTGLPDEMSETEQEGEAQWEYQMWARRA